jgi:hypothetical protein
MTSRHGYNHAEAYCHMTYRTDDGLENVVIWNSRDGVTPFVIPWHGKQARHVNWTADRPDPDYQPQPGDLVFVDLTPERARWHAERTVDAWYADHRIRAQVAKHFGTRKRAIQSIIDSYHEGEPDLIQWQEQPPE